MKKILLLFAILFANVFFIISSTSACTHITIKAKNGDLLVGRTMEFGPNLMSNILTSNRGRKFQTTAPDGKPGLSWKAKYGYLFLDYLHSGNTVDGMNEKGLSFSYLYLPGFTKYPNVPPNKDRNALPYQKLGDWVLSNFQNITEVKQALKKIIVFAKPESFPGHPNIIFPLHAIITDAKGKSIVIEFNREKMQIYDDPIGILTNAPIFPWQMINLKNYANLSPYSPTPIKIHGIIYTGTGQGSGMVGLPGDTTPPSRFVKMAVLKQTASPASNASSALTRIQHILNTVEIPRGSVRGQKNSHEPFETTQWTVYKDLTNHVLYFRSYTNSTLQSIHMDQIDFSANEKPLKMPVANQQIIINATKQFLRSEKK